MSFKKQTVFTVVLSFFLSLNLFAGVNGKSDAKDANRDTLQALVLNSSNPFFKKIEHYSADSILDIIDSVLNEKNIPKNIVNGIEKYAKENNPDFGEKPPLIGYYDHSKYPANRFYQSWSTRKVHPHIKPFNFKDSLLLVLADTSYHHDFCMPLDGIRGKIVITSPFGYRRTFHDYHPGIDLDLIMRNPVYAAFDGKVRYARWNSGGYGRCVVIRHYNGLETVYAHLRKIKVHVGQIVHAGQVIGLGGSSGRSTGSHLHFEIRFKGYALNPANIIDFKDKKLRNDSVYILQYRHKYVAVSKGTEFYTVKRGDFLYKIANRYGTTVHHLCSINNISRNSILSVGERLRISE